MRAAAILGLGCSPKDLKPFQRDSTAEWRIGMPGVGDADVILLFGGDGTIHRHLGQLVKVGLPVLVVPAGSGNDFASSLGLRRVRFRIKCSYGEYSTIRLAAPPAGCIWPQEFMAEDLS